jgi:hypothetical protein
MLRGSVSNGAFVSPAEAIPSPEAPPGGRSARRRGSARAGKVAATVHLGDRTRLLVGVGDAKLLPNGQSIE